MAHGYYNLNGDWVGTATLEEATAAWREERGYNPIGVFDMGDHVVDTTNEQVSAQSAPATPAAPQVTTPEVPATPSPSIGGVQEGAGYNVQGIQGTPAPAVPNTYDVQGIQGTPDAPSSFYDVQSIQGSGASTQQISGATPTEQAAAQGGGVPEEILPYFADTGSGTQYLWSQWPQSAGGIGTPTELRYGQKDAEGNYAGYGPTSYQWSESPASLAELQQGRTPVGPALAAADTVATFLTEFGVRPGFVTPFVAQSLGLIATDMGEMGYVQDLYGQWIALDFGDEPLAGGGGYGGTGAGTGGGYGGGGGGYSSPANFRS